MSENIINLVEAREARQPHMTGPARCLQCGHTWVAVAPAGTVWLCCPECATVKGAFDRPVEPVEGDTIFVCQCGCGFFSIRPDAFLCCGCGIEHNRAKLGV